MPYPPGTIYERRPHPEHEDVYEWYANGEKMNDEDVSTLGLKIANRQIYQFTIDKWTEQ